MKLRVPFYYKEFQCSAGSCKDNCCVGGWEIDIDQETYDYYNELQGDIGDKLRSCIVQNEDGDYCFALKEGKCPMLTEEGLCTIHKELGEQYLGVVCSQFPRFSEYYGPVKESGVGLACEEAARLILSENKPFSMIEDSFDEVYEPDSEYDSSYAAKIFMVRDTFFDILAMEGLSINEKLIVMLHIGFLVQQCVNDGEFDSIKDVISTYVNEGCEKILKNTRDMYDNGEFEDVLLQSSIRDIIIPYEEMEVLNPEWEKLLEDLISSLFEQMDEEEYGILNEEFATYISKREYEYRQILEYMVFRYFAKAIYDYDVLGKCQMFITNFFMLRQMDMFRWLDNHKVYTFEDRMDIIHIFSRQVEYSEENIEDLYEDFIFDDIFKPESLRAILWIDSENI